MSDSNLTSVESDDHRKADWRSYILLLIFQTQNAFNDKAAQFVLIPLAFFLAKEAGDETGGNMHLVLSGLIVLPYIVLSPVVGWLADRISKVGIVRAMALLQVGVLGWILFSVKQQQLWWAVGGFFILAVQSTVLSPAKKGVVKELVGGSKLGLASGLLEMGSVLAILAGQIATSFWYGAQMEKHNDGWAAGEFPLLVVGLASIPAVAMAFGMRPTHARSKRPFSAGIWVEHFHQLKELWSNRVLRLCSLGICYFWTYGGFLLLLFMQIAKEATGSDTEATILAYLMSASSGGVVVGGIVASIVCKRRIELGLVPVGGLLMILGSLLAAFTPTASNMLYLWLVISGMGASCYLVPLNALLQDKCDPDQRGNVLAGVNLQDCLGGMLAVVLQGVLALFFSPSWQFGFVAVTAVFATFMALRLIPQAFVRFVVASVLRLIYRVKPVHAERMPKEGGVLLVSNHVSYADAFFLSMASERPVRFVIAEEYVKVAWMRWFLELFDVVPISTTKAKEAIRTAAEAMQNGDVICIFPEGQLTRTGCINELQQGYRLIARQAKCPVIPVYMDGVWGSIFSFERGSFLKKRPNALKFGIPVIFGEPQEAKGFGPLELRRSFEKLSLEVIQKSAKDDSRSRLESKLKSRKVFLSCAGKAYSGDELRRLAKKRGEVSDPKLKRWLATWQELMDDEDLATMAMTNALQLMRINGLIRETDYALEVGDDWSRVMAVTFPLVAKAGIVLCDSTELATSGTTQWVCLSEVDAPSGVTAYQICRNTPPTRPLLALTVNRSGWIYAAERNLAEYPVKGAAAQPGQLEGSLGQILPGVASDGKGLAMPHGRKVTLPEGFVLDADGWIMPSAATE